MLLHRRYYYFRCRCHSPVPPDIDDADADVTFRGRVCSRAAATGKARSTMVERRVRRTTCDDVEAERRR